LANNVTDVPKKPVNPSELDWNSILKKGAEALANSFGSTLGTGLANALVDALLGKAGTDAAFQNEVLAALKRIEGKLDEVLDFLYKKLPSIIRQQVDAGIVDQEQRDLQAKLATVSANLSMHRQLTREPTEAELLMLVGSANAALELGIRLIQKGQEWYPAGVHAFGGAFAAYAVAIGKNPDLGAMISSYTRDYQRITAPWTEVNSAQRLSFMDLSEDLPKQLALAHSALNPISDRSENVALMWTVAEAFEVPGGGPIPRRFMVFGGWFAFNTATKSLTGDDLIRGLPIPDGPIGDPGELIRRAGFTISPLWTPKNHWANGMAEYDAFVSKLYWALDVTQNHPSRIEIVNQAKNAVLYLQAACRELDFASMALPSTSDA
jgi:hypothetical protein